MTGRDLQSGSSMVELLLALPVVLLLGLGLAQFSLVYQAKHALDYAVTQAARQGAVDHASAAAIRAGFAAGLAPYLYGAADESQLLAAEARAAEHVDEGAAAGWIRLRQRSPTEESFSDWAEPAIDAMGVTIPGLVEIANDNLDSRRLRTQPASGAAGSHLSEPIGRLSGQTLADANLLRLEVTYGLRLVVPVVGPLIIRTLAVWQGCTGVDNADPGRRLAAGGASDPSARERLGLMVLPAVQASETTSAWMCAFIGLRRSDGTPAPRIPLRTSATVRMMSTARRSELTGVRADSAATPARPDSGPTGSAGPEPLADSPAAAVGQGEEAPERPSAPASQPDPVLSLRRNGFLGIGSDRPYPVPTTHPALCPA